MTIKKDQLINRGFLAEGKEFSFLELPYNKRIELLQSAKAIDRTLGARLLTSSKNSTTITTLIQALKIEKKLYSKIEICNTLASFKQLSVKPLISILGEIGNNQHKSIPETKFKKDSYPLPRDIASRILIRIGKDALHELVGVFKSDNTKQISEAIDAIGFICFYDYKSGVYNQLKNCYLKNEENDLIKWKIIRAFSGFNESQSFLQEQQKLIRNKRFAKEIERSLYLVDNRTFNN